MKLLAFGASTSSTSINRRLAVHVANQVPDAQVTDLDLRSYSFIKLIGTYSFLFERTADFSFSGLTGNAYFKSSGKLSDGLFLIFRDIYSLNQCITNWAGRQGQVYKGSILFICRQMKTSTQRKADTF